jgi:chemotaxis protein methyltransferase CheR
VSVASWAQAELPRLTDDEFARYRELVRREAGIHLAPGKRALLTARVGRRVRELGLPTFGAYQRAAAEDPAELVRLLDAITTNETHFFREPGHFRLLDGQVLPAWRAAAAAGTRPRRVRAWSAACSTGEEPFSLAMLLADALPAEQGWDVEVLATDLSTRVLARAREATWEESRAERIPPAYLRRFMLRGTGERAGQVRAGPALRARVRFGRVNLAAGSWGVPGPFDLIFCRNVLMYFDAEVKRSVVHRLVEMLAPGGLLFVGHAESLNGSGAPVRGVGGTVYARDDGFAP